tara:strand:- start:3469 stop:3978 length:510 start_codon:yes stop_codon:yes gene_type:complete
MEISFFDFIFRNYNVVSLVSFHKHSLKKNGVQEITDKNLGVNQKRYVKSELNKSELIKKLKTDPIIGKMKMMEIENGILLKTGMTWKSWGEKIKIILQTKQGSNFDYQISSSPKLKTTLVDYGKNLENVNRIKNVIKNISPASTSKREHLLLVTAISKRKIDKENIEGP